MTRLWCWRCRVEVPMLDEEEFAEVAELYRAAFGIDGDGTRPSAETAFTRVTQAYERMTGVAGCHHNAIMHHRVALYGPPCHRCRKPLRTRDARHCAACGEPR